MSSTEHLILKMLRQELEYHDPEVPYSVWVMGMSLKPQEEENANNSNNSIPNTKTYTARVILKASNESYVDGTDIPVSITNSTAKIINEEFPEYPKLPCVKEEDALQWLKSFYDPCFLQMTDPYNS